MSLPGHLMIDNAYRLGTVVYSKLNKCTSHLSTWIASFPGPAQLPLLAVWKSGRGPGIFYHVSDVEGREKVERT